MMNKFFRSCFCDPTTRQAQIINGFITFLIVFSVAVLPLSFLPPEYTAALEQLLVIEKIIVTVFLIEYIMRVWAARNPFKFIFSAEGIIDLLAVLPFFFEKFGLFGATKVFILLRILRIFKFTAVFQMEELSANGKHNAKRSGWQLLNDEQVLRIYMRHPIIFVTNLILPIILTSLGTALFIFTSQYTLGIIFALLILGFGLLFFIKAWLDYHFDILFITSYRVVVQDHNLFGASANALRYESIVNLVPDNRGILQFILGSGKIEIETASSDKTQVFTFVRKPYSVAAFIEKNREVAIKKLGTKAAIPLTAVTG
jgi:hypothetical protein